MDSNKKYYPFISFKRKFEEAKFLSTEATQKYDKKVSEIEEQEFSDIMNFFKIVYVEIDLRKAHTHIDSFLTNIYCRSSELSEIAKELDGIIEKEKFHGISN